ncbi:MAG: TlpA family protein disulfide reductase [Myxococcota bacterium]
MIALLIACAGEAEKASAPPPSRVDAVVAAPKKEARVEDFCEQLPKPEEAKTFALPEIDGPPMAKGTAWTWVNVWATWCGPCIEEMPRLLRWQAKLAKEGVDVAFWFLSVDAKAEEVSRFKDKHPEAPPTMRLAKIEDLAGWLGSVGLDASAVLPIHLLVDPEQRIRCTRMGSVSEEDYDVVKRVVSGS